MPTVAEVMNDAADTVSITIPTAWTSSTNKKTYRDLLRCLRQTVDDMQKRADWPDLTLDYDVAGDGSASYDLPDAFKRVSRDDLAVYETGLRRGCIPIATNGDWTYLTETGTAANERYYRISGTESAGYSIEFFQPLETGDTVTVSYVSRNWFTVSSVPGYLWTDEGAELMLPRETVFAGVVFRWRQSKGVAYLSYKVDYEKMLAGEANDARGIRKISFGSPRPTRKPWDIPIPDYIPPA